MPLKAIHAATGNLVESFSVTDAEWDAMRAEKGAYVMQHTRQPAVLKQNRAGTRWFQSRPGERDHNYKPESALHLMAKIWMVQALRAAGHHAEVERYGTTPEGDAWEADVYLEVGGRKIAIEVQVSAQSFEDYLYRTQRYDRSDVKVVWLVRLYESFSLDAVKHKGWTPGTQGMWPDLPGMAALPMQLRCALDDPRPDAITIHLPWIGHHPHAAIPVPLTDFALGLAEGRLTFHQRCRWRWRPSPDEA